MSDISHSPTTAEVIEHRHTYYTFERLVLFATLHIALTLSMVALAFIGHIPLLALIGWLGGSVVLISAFAVTAGGFQAGSVRPQ